MVSWIGGGGLFSQVFAAAVAGYLFVGETSSGGG